MSKLLKFFFEEFWGKAVAAAAGLLVLISWFAYEQRETGARNAIAKINQSAGELATKAAQARSDADRPGAAQRLQQHSCRDC